MRATACAALVACLTISVTLAGHDHAPAPDAAKNAAFETLKSLAGTWTGKAGAKGTEGSTATVTYRLTAGGSALVETLFPGTAHEMVTVYHPDGAAVKLTHYCTAGNQPTLRLVAVDGNTYRFDFDSGSNMKPADMHMHAMTLTIKDADHIVAEWTAFKDGQPIETAVFDLTRQG